MITINSEVARWLHLCQGRTIPDDEDTWRFYDDDIMSLAANIEDEAARATALDEARLKLNLHTKPTVFCASCGDTGWVILGMDAAKCPECHGVPDGSTLFKNAGIPKIFQEYRQFATYQEAALVSARKRIAAFIRNYKSGKGLLLMGEAGVGKTHLSIGIIKSLSEQKVRCRFWDINEWLDQLRASYGDDPAEGQRLLDEVKTVELLVFDDLGAQRITDHTTDRLFDVVNSRYLSHLSTVITTNVPSTQIERIYGARLWSRLMAMCDVIEIVTQDHRQRGKARPAKTLLRNEEANDE